MILIDEPYLSPFLRKTIRDGGIPVVRTETALGMGLEGFAHVISEEEAIQRADESANPLLYAVSESSIGWIAKNLRHTPVPGRVDLFKNKAAFRERTRSLFGEFRFQEVAFDGLDSLALEDLPMPFIIKPTVGFFSLGVRRVNSAEDWSGVKAGLQAEVTGAPALFPVEVLDRSNFLIEQCLEGPEFAIDAYFDEQGMPVVLSIFEHLFASEGDMTDRVYVTSKELLEAHLPRFEQFLGELNGVFGVRNFPVHVELRLDREGRPWPIEVNPLRFGGWCTTADVTALAFGVNPYACFFEQKRPDWRLALRNKAGLVYSIVALGNSTGVDGGEIAAFDYEGLLKRFERPLELRKTDYRRYPLFGFVFAETRVENFAEIEWAVHTDLSEFVSRG